MKRLSSVFVAVTLCVAAVIGSGAVTPAKAVCLYYNMDTTGTYATAGNPTIIGLPQNQPVWSAFAVRPVAGEDWDVQLYQNGAADPVCVAGILAASTAGGSGVDFVIGDYRYNPAGVYLARCTQFAGVNNGYLRWTDSPQVMTVNGPTTYRSWGGLDVIETWNISLQSGTTYNVNLATGGTLDAKVMLFRNPAASTYWVGRSAAVLSTSTSTTYTAPSTDTYAVVVVNDNGGAGSLSLAIGTCTPPVALVNGTAVHTPLGHTYHQFTQSSAYWTAVGVRSTVADYDVTSWTGTAGVWPNCLSSPQATSGLVGAVDLVIGDFNHVPTGTYYASTTDFSATGGADIEWDSGANLLNVNDAAIARTSDNTDVLEVWDVFLSAGQTYNFAFDPSSTDLHLLLFRNPTGGVYWTGRSAAEFDVTGCQTYTAPTTGYYGVVVTNETGAATSYSLGVSQAPCPCATTLFPQFPVAPPNPDGYYRFTQSPNFWAVVATRGATNGDDWDLTVSGSATGNPAPTCIGAALVSSSYGAGLVDIGVIDFNATPLGTYFARSHRFSGAGGVMEWDWSHGELSHNGYATVRSIASNDLAHAWDAYMIGGQTYQLEYTPSDPTIKLLVFENAGGGSYAVSRSAAVLTTSGTIAYTPTVTGYHGLIVVNDQAVNGSYSIRFGHCATAALTSQVPAVAGDALNSYSFAQPASRWAAVGVRSSTADWDVRVSGTTSSPFPNCVGASLATSTAGVLNYVDVVAGDFFHNAPGTYYVDAFQFSGAVVVPSTVEWDAGTELLVNSTAGFGMTDASNMMRSWSTYLQSGVTYTITFNHSYTADLHLLLFRNPGGGDYWAGRTARLLDITPGAPVTYTPPSTGEYGLVLVNDSGDLDYYNVNVNTCFAPTALASGIVQTDLPVGFHSFTQAASAWTAVGVRSPDDWDISVNQNAGGGLPGFCQSGNLAVSVGVGSVDFVVGDFNAGANAPGTYYVRTSQFSGSASGTTEWDSGADKLTVGGAIAHRTTDASDVLEVWDVFLTAGHAYGIYFARSGAADTRVMLFRNPGGVYWASRGAAVLQGTTSASYTPPTTGWYGVVVVNDNGAAGSYDVGVSSTPLAVETASAPATTALRLVEPNPVRVRASIEYTLRERAPVRLQLLDLAGRVVADVENGTREAGVWRAAWNGRTNAGRKAAPGIYLVRLEVDGRAIGQRKLTVLE